MLSDTTHTCLAVQHCLLAHLLSRISRIFVQGSAADAHSLACLWERSSPRVRAANTVASDCVPYEPSAFAKLCWCFALLVTSVWPQRVLLHRSGLHTLWAQCGARVGRRPARLYSYSCFSWFRRRLRSARYWKFAIFLGASALCLMHFSITL